MQFHPIPDQCDLASSWEDGISARLPVIRWHDQKSESAFIMAAAAAKHNAAWEVQIHGGIRLSSEAEPQLCGKKAPMLTALWREPEAWIEHSTPPSIIATA